MRLTTKAAATCAAAAIAVLTAGGVASADETFPIVLDSDIFTITTSGTTVNLTVTAPTNSTCSGAVYEGGTAHFQSATDPSQIVVAWPTDLDTSPTNVIISTDSALAGTAWLPPNADFLQSPISRTFTVPIGEYTVATTCIGVDLTENGPVIDQDNFAAHLKSFTVSQGQNGGDPDDGPGSGGSLDSIFGS